MKVKEKQKPDIPPRKCVICPTIFAPYHKRQVTCGSAECQRVYASKTYKRLGIPQKRKPWDKCNASERWEQMTLTELSGEIARMFPGKSYADIRTLKEQGKLPEDFGKDVRG